MIKLNIQLFAQDPVKDSENCSMVLYKQYYTAKGILYKAIVKIHSEFFIKDESALDETPSWYDILAIAKLYSDTTSINLLTSNNYVWDKVNGDLYIEIPEDGTWHAQIWESIDSDYYYVSSSVTVSNLVPKTDTTKTIQKTTEIVTQQIGEPEKVGVIKMFSGSVPPLGWLLCDGAAISRTKYSKLFSVIGTAYGSGDGETTFNLPNLKGKTIVGLDEADSDFGVLGKTGGEKTHKLKINEMPKHFHANKYTFNDVSGSGWTYRVRNGAAEGTTDGTGDGFSGGDQPHNNLQPYIVLNYIIKAVETKNLQAQVVDSLEGNSTSTSPSVRAVKSAISANYDSIPLGTVLDYEGTEIPEGYERVNETPPKILWKNANPNTLFRAQTIELSSDDYDELEILYIDYQSSNRLMSTKVLKNHPGNLQACFQYQDHGYVGAREFTFTDSTHIKFVNCVSIIQQDAFRRVAVEDWCNPVYIIGYKTGLFS